MAQTQNDQDVKQSYGGWKCQSCNLINYNPMGQCQACYSLKYYSKAYDHYNDEDLADLIMKCDESQLNDIFRSLEYQNAIYKNHSFLSLLVDIGKISLIFLLFQKGYKFALNYAPSINDKQTDFEDDGDEETKQQHPTKQEIYVDDDKILPLSMAFERDELYLIKFLLRNGASPNQCTRPENLSLNYEWFDLTFYEIYLHYLPISIPFHKLRNQTNDELDEHHIELSEYEEIFDLLIHFGALWYEDEYMFSFCNKDASFWMDFLSSYKYRNERFFVHNAMKKYYLQTIKPLILKTSIRECEYIIKQYFTSFPMVDISNQDDNNPLAEIANVVNKASDLESNDIYAKILEIKPSDDVCKQYEYIIMDEHQIKMNMLVYDERIWKEVKVNDIVYIKNAKLLQLNDSNEKIPKFNIVHSMTLTPSISVIYDENVRDKFKNTH